MRIRVTAHAALAILVTVGIVAGASCRVSEQVMPPATEVAGRPVPEVSPMVEVVATDLVVPWALAFAPDGRLFFTERPGRVRVIVGGQLQGEPVAQLPASEIVEAGLLGLALDPAFEENGYLYVMYTYFDITSGLRNRVSRLTERQGRAGDEVVLLDDLPGGFIHNGGRIKFGPDGRLYITLGDTGNSSLAQQLDSPAGKILRINPDGSIPTDNPFPNSPVYSYGHRNLQGLAWHPITGQLFISEHGPTGDDEINIIQASANYGWPEVSGSDGSREFVDPILVFNPAVAPSGAAFYDGDRLTPWRNSLFIATLRGRSLLRIVLPGPRFASVEEQERLFEDQFGRLRDVIQGPDGFLYFTTSNRDGRGSLGSNDDRILRIVPR